ncbi:MAG: IS200/IS605 family transposase [Candidatus Methanoperedens sp.]|nr:IS200/IS605 family transposase [Candidatus Methanoperedens sp.]
MWVRLVAHIYVAMITEGIICKTCKELDIEIIEIAVNPDHVHIFFKYPPKNSLIFIAKRLKGRTSRILRKEFPHLKEWCGEHMWAPSCFHGSVGNGWEVVEKYIRMQDKHHAKPTSTGLVHRKGYTVTRMSAQYYAFFSE